MKAIAILLLASLPVPQVHTPSGPGSQPGPHFAQQATATPRKGGKWYLARTGHAVYDFLGGRAAYKERLATSSTRLVWLRVQRPLARFSIEASLRACKQALAAVPRRPAFVLGVVKDRCVHATAGSQGLPGPVVSRREVRHRRSAHACCPPPVRR